MDYANWNFLKYRRSLLRLLNAMALNSVRLYLQRRHLVCQKINHCNTVGCHVCQGSPTILSLIPRSPSGGRQASSSIVAVVLVQRCWQEDSLSALQKKKKKLHPSTILTSTLLSAAWAGRPVSGMPASGTAKARRRTTSRRMLEAPAVKATSAFQPEPSSGWRSQTT